MEAECVSCLLGALGGSSSSLLNVKSITCPIDLLVLPDGAITECSLDDSGGVFVEVELLAPIRVISEISTSSSSSPLLGCSPLRLGALKSATA